MTDIQDKIEAWHFDGAGAGLEIWEYLGWTYEQYHSWASTGVLPSESI